MEREQAVITQHQLVWTALCLALVQVRCAQPLPRHDPPAGALFYYPMAVAAPQDATGTLQGDKAYVVSTNFDQRFDTGWITEINVSALKQAIEDHDPAAARGAMTMSLKVPTLGGRLMVTPDATRAYLPHRGTGLLTTMELDASGALHCGDPRNKDGLDLGLQRTDCDRGHLVDLVAKALQNNLNYRDFQDPFSVTEVSQGSNSYAVVGYLSAAWLSVLEPATGFGLVRNINLGTGTLQSLQPTPQAPGHVTGTSRKIDTTQDYSTVYDVDVAGSVAVAADIPPTRTSVAKDAGGIDLYNAVFSPDGQRLFVTNRGPDAVVALAQVTTPVSSVATERTPKVEPKTTLQVTSAAVLAGTSPSDLVYLSRGGNQDLLVVAATLQDSIYFLSPVDGIVQVVSRLPLNGRGPFGLVHVRRDNEFDYLLVSTFYDHGLSVIDVSGTDVLAYRELIHISESGTFGYAQRSR